MKKNRITKKELREYVNLVTSEEEAPNVKIIFTRLIKHGRYLNIKNNRRDTPRRVSTGIIILNIESHLIHRTIFHELAHHIAYSRYKDATHSEIFKRTLINLYKKYASTE